MWLDTGSLEIVGGSRNGSCSGEMHRDDPEHQLRRQAATTDLTLRHESMGSKQD